MTDWADNLIAPAGARALITARCVRCYRVAAKYWEHDGDGKWIAQRREPVADRADLLRATDDDARVRNVVAARVCHCDPPPVLPEGGKLAALAARARARMHGDPAPSPFPRSS